MIQRMNTKIYTEKRELRENNIKNHQAYKYRTESTISLFPNDVAAEDKEDGEEGRVEIIAQCPTAL